MLRRALEMTEPEWQALAEPEQMLGFLQNMVSDRQMRLVALACCRNAWSNVVDGLQLLDEAEPHVESSVDWLAWVEAQLGRFGPQAALQHASGDPGTIVRLLTSIARLRKWSAYGERAGLPAPPGGEVPTARTTWASTAVARTGEQSSQSVLIREICANRLRPLPPPPEAIAPLAERIYAGEWNLMPILGEWLQEHG
jgi:hypothetical protein